jgi:hypothetical protein
MTQISESTLTIGGGDKQVRARQATRDDWPAIVALNCSVPDVPPEKPLEEMTPEERAEYGGPWMSIETLTPHYQEYERRGFPILVAESADSRIVGHLDLWLADEPEPVGRAACAEVVMEHAAYLGSGLENALLRYAAEVAVAFGLPALEGGMGIGGLGDDYLAKRALGFYLWDEHDRVEVASTGAPSAVEAEPVSDPSAVLQGLTILGRWAPRDYVWWFRRDPGNESLLRLEVQGEPCLALAVDAAEWGGGTEPGEVQDLTFYVPAARRHDPRFLSSVLGAYAAAAESTGAQAFRTWVPCCVSEGLTGVEVRSVTYGGAWLRKRLP